MGSEVKVKLVWIKSHSGLAAHDTADWLAKEGAQMERNTDFFRPALVRIKEKTRIQYQELWDQKWKKSSTCKHTKNFISSIKSYNYKPSLGYSRVKLSKAIQYITGHNYFRSHQAKVGRVQTDRCRLCGSEAETYWHLISSCPGTAKSRNAIQSELSAGQRIVGTVLRFASLILGDAQEKDE